MNKLFSKIAALSVGLAMAIGVGVAVGSNGVKEAKADEVFYTLDGTITGGSAGYDTESEITQSGLSWKATGNTTMNPWRIGGKSLSGVDRPIYSTTAMGSAITKMELTVGAASSITVNSLKLIVASDEDFSNKIDEISESFSANSTITFVPSNSASSWATNSYYKILFNVTVSGTSNKFVAFNNAKFYSDGSTPVKYTVSYDVNGGTGSVTDANKYDKNAEVTVLGIGSVTKTGYSFVNWSDGTNNYDEGDKFTITSNVTLIAQWELASKYTDDTTAQTITWDLSVPSYSSESADQVSWESPRVNMVADKAGASTAANNYLPPDQSSSRFYKSSTLTFAPQGDNGILSIEATATTDNYANALAGSTWTNASAAVSGEDSKVVIITVTEGYEDVVATIGATTGLNKCVVHYGTPTPVTKYAVIDRIDDGSLDVTEVAEGTTLNATITPDDGYALPESVSVLMAGSPVEFTYANGVVTVQNVIGNVSIEGSCVKINQILALYSKSSSASVDVYGYYVGFLDGTGPVIMDGEYGIVVYSKTADVSDYTEGETILHVTGSISIYSGLYEIGSATISAATSVPEDKVPATPVVYSAKGGETAEYASRLTTVTGTATLYPDPEDASKYGDFDADAGTKDIRMKFAVGDQEIVVFYKKAAQTADSEAFAAMKAACGNNIEITIKGFTGWYYGFQVQMNGYVPPVEGYTAEDFAQDLLDQTDAVCAGWEEGDNNHDALEAIWSNLASNDKYPSLPAAQKTILAEANRDESGTVVEQAMARYDFLTGKYDLSNFINGRTPIVPAGRIDFSNDFSQNSSMIIIVSIAATSALAFTMLLVFKKKKQK